jgi:F-type H+-transporting ATPase subunit epsilon
MAKTDTFSCTVITPERKVLECDARFVAFPAHDGEMGVLRQRAPLVCKLGIGPLRVETPSEKHLFFIDEGFAQVVDNRLTILTEQARAANDIDAAAAQSAMVEARAMKITDPAAGAARGKAIQRAQVQLKLSRK